MERSSPSTAGTSSFSLGSSRCECSSPVPQSILTGGLSSPYYVTLCTSRRTDTSTANQAYEIDAGNTISASASPLLVPVRQSNATDPLPELTLGLAALARSQSLRKSKSRRASSAHSDTTRIDIAPELSLSSFHFGKRQFRVPYLDLPVHKEFRTWSESRFESVLGFSVADDPSARSVYGFTVRPSLESYLNMPLTLFLRSGKILPSTCSISTSPRTTRSSASPVLGESFLHIRLESSLMNDTATTLSTTPSLPSRNVSTPSTSTLVKATFSSSSSLPSLPSTTTSSGS